MAVVEEVENSLVSDMGQKCYLDEGDSRLKIGTKRSVSLTANRNVYKNYGIYFKRSNFDLRVDGQTFKVKFYVDHVVEQSEAFNAGIQHGDVVLDLVRTRSIGLMDAAPPTAGSSLRPRKGSTASTNSNYSINSNSKIKIGSKKGGGDTGGGDGGSKRKGSSSSSQSMARDASSYDDYNTEVMLTTVSNEKLIVSAVDVDQFENFIQNESEIKITVIYVNAEEWNALYERKDRLEREYREKLLRMQNNDAHLNALEDCNFDFAYRSATLNNRKKMSSSHANKHKYNRRNSQPSLNKLSDCKSVSTSQPALYCNESLALPSSLSSPKNSLSSFLTKQRFKRSGSNLSKDDSSHSPRDNNDESKFGSVKSRVKAKRDKSLPTIFSKKEANAKQQSTSPNESDPQLYSTSRKDCKSAGREGLKGEGDVDYSYCYGSSYLSPSNSFSSSKSHGSSVEGGGATGAVVQHFNPSERFPPKTYYSPLRGGDSVGGVVHETSTSSSDTIQNTLPRNFKPYTKSRSVILGSSNGPMVVQHPGKTSLPSQTFHFLSPVKTSTNCGKVYSQEGNSFEGSDENIRTESYCSVGSNNANRVTMLRYSSNQSLSSNWSAPPVPQWHSSPYSNAVADGGDNNNESTSSVNRTDSSAKPTLQLNPYSDDNNSFTGSPLSRLNRQNSSPASSADAKTLKSQDSFIFNSAAEFADVSRSEFNESNSREEEVYDEDYDDSSTDFNSPQSSLPDINFSNSYPGVAANNDNAASDISVYSRPNNLLVSSCDHPNSSSLNNNNNNSGCKYTTASVNNHDRKNKDTTGALTNNINNVNVNNNNINNNPVVHTPISFPDKPRMFYETQL